MSRVYVSELCGEVRLRGGGRGQIYLSPASPPCRSSMASNGTHAPRSALSCGGLSAASAAREYEVDQRTGPEGSSRGKAQPPPPSPCPGSGSTELRTTSHLVLRSSFFIHLAVAWAWWPHWASAATATAADGAAHISFLVPPTSLTFPESNIKGHGGALQLQLVSS